MDLPEQMNKPFLLLNKGETMNKPLIYLILAGSLFVPTIASAEVWILWEELYGKTPYIVPSTIHGFESRGQCIAAANKIMKAVASKDGFELSMDPFDPETLMGRRGTKPNLEYKYALCYPSNFDPRDKSKKKP